MSAARFDAQVCEMIGTHNRRANNSQRTLPKSIRVDRCMSTAIDYNQS